jgi:mono/diheme cytochrome c family protein
MCSRDCNPPPARMLRYSLAAVLVSACALAACSTTPTRTVTGADTFATHCASCHGPQGEGDGPVAATMRVTVPNLRSLTERNAGRFPTEAVATYIDGRNMPAAHGDRYMPVWGGVFATTEELIVGAENPKQRIDAVIEFLLQLQID